MRRRLLASMLRRSGAAILLTVVVTAGLVAADVLAPLERAFGDLRFRLLPRPATGEVVLVLIDSRSLEALPVWPWPRAFHARTLEALRGAGAARIAVDIDFSAHSTPAADAALERALRGGGAPVVLPVFQQHRGLGGADAGVAVTRPLPRFAGAATLAGVNMRPDHDGLVRDHAAVQDIGGERLPSLAARLAGPGRSPDAFGIDFGIRVDTLPVLSYVDVYRGAFDPAAVAGRTVIVGASAFELGDVLAVPVHKALPGPVVHALAYESIVQGRALRSLAPGPVLGGAVALAFVLCPLFRRWRWRAGLAVAAGGVGLVLAGAVALQAVAPVRPELMPWAAAIVLAFIAATLGRIDELVRRVFRQSMALLHRTALLKSVVEDSFDGVLITNHERRIELVNEAGLGLFGLAGQNVVGRPVAEVLPQLVASDAFPAGQVGAADGPWVAHFEIAVPLADGGARRLAVSARSSVLRSGNHPMERRHRSRTVLVFVFRDVTAQREAEEARELALRQAQAASKAKSDFLANMSHELRTPLNAIIGFSEIIKGGLLGPVGTPAYADYAGDIHRSGSHLLGIINDILDLSRVESGAAAMADQPVDMGGVVRFAARMVDARATTGGVAVTIDPEPALPALRGDERLLRQVVVNLLSNAVKFTPSGGSVRVSLAVEADGALLLRVADTGIGIGPADLPEVVKPFRQADAGLNRRFEGTGLGLALVKSFVELHGGTFGLESTLGRGTTASVRFPAARLHWPADAVAGRSSA